jgi:hypothetical protein
MRQGSVTGWHSTSTFALKSLIYGFHLFSFSQAFDNFALPDDDCNIRVSGILYVPHFPLLRCHRWRNQFNLPHQNSFPEIRRSMREMKLINGTLHHIKNMNVHIVKDCVGLIIKHSMKALLLFDRTAVSLSEIQQFSRMNEKFQRSRLHLMATELNFRCFSTSKHCATCARNIAKLPTKAFEFVFQCYFSFSPSPASIENFITELITV